MYSIDAEEIIICAHALLSYILTISCLLAFCSKMRRYLLRGTARHGTVGYRKRGGAWLVKHIVDVAISPGEKGKEAVLAYCAEKIAASGPWPA